MTEEKCPLGSLVRSPPGLGKPRQFDLGAPRVVAEALERHITGRLTDDSPSNHMDLRFRFKIADSEIIAREMG
jgi:hypothetical protein